jgi:exosortase A-associated hydrolase 1
VNWSERALTVDCQGDTLVAVLSLPAATPSAGVVIVVGGPQYRAGSHRQFTELARSLSASGLAVLRADVRGMGDSTGAQRTFEDLGDDVGALTDALRAAVPGVQRLVLWALCDGASAALLHLHAKPESRVDGLVVVNPWVKTPQLEARARLKNYYLQRVLQKSFWQRLLTGRIGTSALGDMASSVRQSGRGNTPASAEQPFPARMLSAIKAFHRPVLLILSGRDQTAHEFAELVKTSKDWRAVLSRPTTQRLDFPDADHTFSDRAGMKQVAQATANWVLSV